MGKNKAESLFLSHVWPEANFASLELEQTVLELLPLYVGLKLYFSYVITTLTIDSFVTVQLYVASSYLCKFNVLLASL